jgi:hypothetical protein
MDILESCTFESSAVLASHNLDNEYHRADTLPMLPEKPFIELLGGWKAWNCRHVQNRR